MHRVELYNRIEQREQERREDFHRRLRRGTPSFDRYRRRFRMVPLVQSTTFGSAPAVSSLGGAFGSNNTVGNLLVCFVGVGSFHFTVTVSDTQLNTWVQATTVDGTTSGVQLEIWYAANCKAGANTVTANWGTAVAFDEVTIAEFSGCATSSPLDAAGTPTSGTSTTPSASVTTGAANALVVAYTTTASGVSPTNVSPYSLIQQGSVLGCASEYNVPAGSGSQTATFSVASTGWDEVIAAFKAAVGGTALDGIPYGPRGVQQPVAGGWV